MLDKLENISYKEFQKYEKVKDWLDVKYNEKYVLLDGFGSIYKGNNSVGYFNAGSIIEFQKGDLVEFINAKITGNSFKVIQDSYFGNTPSKSINTKISATGEIPFESFPKIAKLSYVLKGE